MDLSSSTRWTVDRFHKFGVEAQYIRRYHKHEPKENQCTSEFVRHIKAPVDLVWSLVRRFDQPQRYKPFVSRCVMQGDLNIGSLRQYLDENKWLILKILENQNSGKLSENAENQATL
ncbi:Abscisic acid receptor PYL3 [Camellia lanceoleosa]|uniref:Abscisic acid receptor PYL3 n=1 Tax=Camellia lanceoleosa TaxID=1840588 RepID=A0ACC0G352_9ERIC|nr:Abscisic acid receptor PYL3 [Camellia lanceoleosa]